MAAQDVEDGHFENLPIGAPCHQQEADKVVAIAIKDFVEFRRQVKETVTTDGKKTTQVILNLRLEEQTDKDIIQHTGAIAGGVFHAAAHHKAAADHQIVVAQQIHHLRDHGRIMVEVGVHHHQCAPSGPFQPIADRICQPFVLCAHMQTHQAAARPNLVLISANRKIVALTHNLGGAVWTFVVHYQHFVGPAQRSQRLLNRVDQITNIVAFVIGGQNHRDIKHRLVRFTYRLLGQAT